MRTKTDETTKYVTALRVIEQGNPFQRSWVSDSTDSFYGGTDDGLRLGKVELRTTSNGSLVLDSFRDIGRGGFWTIYDSSGHGNTALGLEIRRRFYERLGLRDFYRTLPGQQDLRSRRERIALLLTRPQGLKGAWI